MPSDQLILWIIVALGPVAAIFALWRILTGPRIISKLMLRYLMKRRIAWVSLIAVMLCTAMVLIVISVMGGWLRMFRETNHNIIGDLIISRGNLDSFSNYKDMMAEIEKLPDVQAITPTVHTWGYAEIGLAGTPNPDHDAVEVVGLDIEKIGEVNGFVRSLHLQQGLLLAKADRLAKLAAAWIQSSSTRPAYQTGPDFDDFGAWEDPSEEAATAESFRVKAATFPSFVKILPDYVYHDQFPNYKGTDPAKWGGIIVGSGVIGLRGDTDRTDKDYIYKAKVRLTIMKDMPESGALNLQENTTTSNYWLIDDSHTDVYQVDQSTVYLPFDVLQKQMGMQGGDEVTDAVTGKTFTESARCNELLIKLKSGADPQAAKREITAIVDDIVAKNNLNYSDFGQLRVETWDENRKDFLNAVEHEKGLLVILFAIISLVAVFLIFCIFFMIVMEKTRDIGIVKSVGATAWSIAAIFLGYGLCIGVVGGGMGLLMAYLVVHNINELHTWMSNNLGVSIWNAKTYLFDTIPNTMETQDVVVIVSVAILSSVLGALVPAIRAARMNPVEALRWE